MIKRLVKLSFQEDKIPEFLEIFNSSKSTILASEGCISLELLKDINKPNTLYTLSKWEDSDSLESYRKSEFFKNTWSKTKILFSSKAEAISLESLDYIID